MEITQAHIKHLGTGKLMTADLFDDITDDHLEMWRSTWLPVIKQKQDEFDAQNIPKEQRPGDMHWNWDAKLTPYRGQLGLKAYALICEGRLQGMMQVSLIKHAILQEQLGKPVVFIDFLSSAPWNRRDLTNTPEFGRIGSLLFRTAIRLSMEEGFRGRVGLSSLPQSIDFYRNACGMTECGCHPHYPALTNFEITADQAAVLLES